VLLPVEVPPWKCIPPDSAPTFRCAYLFSAAQTPAAVDAIIITIAVSFIFVSSASAGGRNGKNPTECGSFLVGNTHG